MRFQIIVNNTSLDLNENTSLTFKFVNDVFGFDKIELSRTAEFDVPTTPRNQSIFDFAERVDLTGGAMRVINTAYLNYSGGQIVGKLSISYATPTNYKCCFLYGEMQALSAIKAAGNISEYLNFPSYYNLPLTIGVMPSPNITDGSMWGWLRYDSGQGSLDLYKLPVTGLRFLIDACANYFNVDVTALQSLGEDYAIILNTLNAEDFSISSHTMTIATNGMPSGFNSNYFSNDWLTFAKKGGVESVPVYYCTQACKIRLSGTNTQTSTYQTDQFINRVVIVARGIGAGQGYSYYIHLDDFEATIQKKSSDTNLNFECELQVGDLLFFADYVLHTPPYGAAYYRYLRPAPVAQLTFTFDVLGSSATTQLGGTYYLQPNLPELTFLDLLKTLVNTRAYALTYDSSTKTFNMFNWDFDSAGGEVRKLEDSLAKITKIERNFLEFAQSNGRVFDNNDFVDTTDRAIVEKFFNVPNLNLDKYKDIFTFPLSQAKITTISTSATEQRIAKVPCLSVDDSGNYMLEATNKPTLVKVSSGAGFINVLYNNANLQNICTLSTKIEAEAVMTEREFLSTTRYTTYTYAGGKYAVIDAEWGNGVAKLKLQRYK